MIKRLKIKDSEYYPKGQWVNIANEFEKTDVNDDFIYYYVEDSFDLSKVNVGDNIMLDEEFEIVGVEE